MSQNNQDCASTTAEPEEPQINPKQETKRIERYKAALAAAKAGAAAKAYEEERQAYEKRREEILKRREEMRKKRKNQTWSKTHHLRGSKIGIFPTK